MPWADVSGLAVGDRVMAPMAAGSYAEAFLSPAHATFPVPPNVDLDTAAAVALQGLTAHYLVTSSYPLAAGDKCLIHAGAGGVGGLLTQMAKQVGAGNAVIGGGIGDTPVIVRPNGIPVKAVAVLGGGSLVQLIAHADRGINGPADLKGKTVTALSLL